VIDVKHAVTLLALGFDDQTEDNNSHYDEYYDEP